MKKSVERNRSKPALFGTVQRLCETRDKDGEGLVRGLGRSPCRSTSFVLINFRKVRNKTKALLTRAVPPGGRLAVAEGRRESAEALHGESSEERDHSDPQPVSGSAAP